MEKFELSEQNKAFAIDRKSGEIDANSSLFFPVGHPATVLARGNTENSFVVTYALKAGGGGVHAAYFRVEENHKSSKKPFIGVDGGTVYSGLCE